MTAHQLFRFLFLTCSVVLVSCAQTGKLSHDLKREWYEITAADILNDEEDMPPLSNYRPPAEMFESDDSDDVKPAPAPRPFLTAINSEDKAPPDITAAKVTPVIKEETFKSDVKQKPKVKTKTKEKEKEKSKDGKTRKKNKEAKIITADKDQQTKQAKQAKDVPPQKSGPAYKSTTQLEDGQRLVNPTARDVLASIEGKKAVKVQAGNKISLTFRPGDSILDLNMKNNLLSKFIPGVRQRQDTVRIQAYASDDLKTKQIANARASELLDFFAGAGIDEAKIMVMPLTDNVESSAYDRVDIQASGTAD